MSNLPAGRKPAREKPSVVTKERLSQIMVQEITETGRVARQICQQSGSREVRSGLIQMNWGDVTHIPVYPLKF